MSPSHPHILLVSGIFFPDLGGPAIHVRKIAEAFTRKGWNVTVVAFGDHDVGEPYRVVRISRHQNKLLSWFRYSIAVMVEGARADIIYAFDLTTSGLPSALASVVFRVPLLIRIGGDPIWERTVEKGRRVIPLDRYYARGLHRKDRPVLYVVLRLVVRLADRIVVYSPMLKDLYVQYFGANPAAVQVVPNPIPTRVPAREPGVPFTFMFAGRFVKYKNLDMVVRAAAKVGGKDVRLLFVGDGPEKDYLQEIAHTNRLRLDIEPKMAQEQLFERIDQAAVALAPALTEFNPNFILESIARGKPALISRGNGLSVNLPPYMQFDPEDEKSLTEAMQGLLNPVRYEAALADIANLPAGRTWDEVTATHADIVSAHLETL